MLVVIVYDISTAEAGGQKRLRKVARLCRDWGISVQDSVYECELDASQYMKNIDFGNGRYVRTIVERAAMAQASRLLNERDGEISNADIRLLCEEDFTAAIHREKEDQRMPMGFAG